ncbi:MAG TPA: hypothetical protein PKH07_15990, partial [bacterium]|nr:hypothetical protein [bacterium]
LEPRIAYNHRNLALALWRKGDSHQAAIHYEDSLRLDPNDTDVRLRLAEIYKEHDKPEQVLSHYRTVLESHPELWNIAHDLAWFIVNLKDESLRDTAEAVRLAEYAVKMAPEETPVLLNTLAAAYAEASRFDDAVKSIDKSIVLARSIGREDYVVKLMSTRERYVRGESIRGKAR